MRLPQLALTLPAAALLTAPLVPTHAQGILRASVDSAGQGTNDLSRNARASADGSVIVFESWATNLSPVDSNLALDVFVRNTNTGLTKRVSVSSSGAQGNQSSVDPSITADGRYVFFTSGASNLVPNDQNGAQDVFRHDRQTGATTRVSLGPGGDEGDNASYQPEISADGRYLVFTSAATNFTGLSGTGWEIYLRDLQLGTTELITVDLAGQPGGGGYDPALSDDGRYVVFSSIGANLVPNDTNNGQDLFVRDRLLGTTTRVNLTTAGAQTSAPGAVVLNGQISNDGRFVTYWSGAGNIVPGDSNGYPDTFLHDRDTGETTRLSVDAQGVQGNFPSGPSSISDDGRYVAFESWASNLVPGDGNGRHDIFVRDLWAGTIQRVSVDATGLESNGYSYNPRITGDGRYVVFESDASNLVAGDTNGVQDIYRVGPLEHSPAPRLAVNGLDGLVSLPHGTPITVTVALDAGDFAAQPYDWWIWAETAGGDFWLLPNLVWFFSAVPIPFIQTGAISFPPFPVVTGATLPVGEYEIHFALDALNATLEGTFQNTLKLTIF